MCKFMIDSNIPMVQLSHDPSLKCKKQNSHVGELTQIQAKDVDVLERTGKCQRMYVGGILNNDLI